MIYGWHLTTKKHSLLLGISAAERIFGSSIKVRLVVWPFFLAWFSSQKWVRQEFHVGYWINSWISQNQRLAEIEHDWTECEVLRKICFSNSLWQLKIQHLAIYGHLCKVGNVLLRDAHVHHLSDRDIAIENDNKILRDFKSIAPIAFYSYWTYHISHDQTRFYLILSCFRVLTNGVPSSFSSHKRPHGAPRLSMPHAAVVWCHCHVVVAHLTLATNLQQLWRWWGRTFFPMHKSPGIIWEWW